MGTDYPFDMADYDPIDLVASAELDESALAVIAGGNIKALLGL
jgi:aminocarboxymuconate-semialdehyde decarboxylase